jgi:hypothetical protein
MPLSPSLPVRLSTNTFVFLATWTGASIDDQENRALGIGNEALDKFDKDAAVLDHERLRVTAEA